MGQVLLQISLAEVNRCHVDEDKTAQPLSSGGASTKIGPIHTTPI